MSVTCSIDTDGLPRDCHTNWIHGDPAFGDAALSYARTTRYAPATHNGVAIAVHHSWVIKFRLPVPQPPDPATADEPPSPGTPAIPRISLQYPPSAQRRGEEGAVAVSCEVSVQGLTTACRVIWIEGDPVFGPSALQFAESNRYRPATVNGIPTATRRYWVIYFRLTPS